MVYLIEIAVADTSAEQPIRTSCASTNEEMQRLLDIAMEDDKYSLCLVQNEEDPPPPPSTTTACEPTTGTCASTKEELLNLWNTANEHDTVALCDGADIDVLGGSTTTTTYYTAFDLVLCRIGLCLETRHGSDGSRGQLYRSGYFVCGQWWQRQPILHTVAQEDHPIRNCDFCQWLFGLQRRQSAGFFHGTRRPLQRGWTLGFHASH